VPRARQRRDRLQPDAVGTAGGRFSHERAAALDPGDWRRSLPEFQEPHLSRNLALADALAAIGERHGAGAGAVAIAWALAWTGSRARSWALAAPIRSTAGSAPATCA